MGEEPQGRNVCPVRIVDHQQQRPPLPETHDDPVQGVHDPEDGIAAGRTRGAFRAVQKDPAGRRRRALEHPIGPPQAAAQQALEQRPRDAPGERLLQLVPACPQHQQARTSSARGGVVQQSGLAEPGRCLDQNHASCPALGADQDLGDDPELHIALQQGLPLRRWTIRPGRHHASVVPPRPVNQEDVASPCPGSGWSAEKAAGHNAIPFPRSR
jgi:hypothetical protein